MKALFDKPETVAAFAKKQPANDFNRAQSEFALEKLARKDTKGARRLRNRCERTEVFTRESASIS